MAVKVYQTEFGEGYSNPRNQAFFDQWNDEEVIVDPRTGETYVKPSKKQPGLQEQARDYAEREVKKEALNYGRDAVKEAFGMGGGAALNAATSGASTGLASTAAQNAAWNSTAMGGQALPEVAGASAPGAFSLSGIGSAGNAILPAAGAIGMYDLYANRPEEIGHGRGYLQGAASGAALGSYFGLPGAAIGAGLGLAANAFGIGGESATKLEEKKRDALAEAGIVIPNSGQKEWELNEAFKESRNEADLKGKDIIHGADFYGIQGFADQDAAKQEAIAQEAINQGLIREHHGTVSLNMTPQYQKYLEEQLTVPEAPTSNGGGVDRNRLEAENKRQRKKQALASILPDVMSTPTKGPRYDQNPGALITNPYL